jgi:surface polysaccharide O-acyltransferase-like enzyme
MNHRINLLRSIAILLVLLQHVSSWCQFYSPSPFVNIVYTSIATTGVPIFIMITGALLLPKYDEPI